MQSIFFTILAIGLVICGFGMFCVTYLYRPPNDRFSGNRTRGATRASAWPLYVGIVCIPLGVIIVFGAIILRNNLPR